MCWLGVQSRWVVEDEVEVRCWFECWVWLVDEFEVLFGLWVLVLWDGEVAVLVGIFILLSFDDVDGLMFEVVVGVVYSMSRVGLICMCDIVEK